MKNYTKNYLQGILRDYPQFDFKIEKRKASLRNPDTVETDENIGGTSGNNVGSPVERIATAIADDEEIAILESHQKAIKEILNRSDATTRDVIRLRYFEKQLKQVDVSKELGVTIATVRILEIQYIKKLARKMKLMR